jgi:hypothetical protein
MLAAEGESIPVCTCAYSVYVIGLVHCHCYWRYTLENLIQFTAAGIATQM